MVISAVVGDYGKATTVMVIMAKDNNNVMVIMANDNKDRNGDYGKGQQQP